MLIFNQIGFQIFAVLIILITSGFSYLLSKYPFIARAWLLPFLQPHHFLVGNIFTFWQNKGDITKFMLSTFRRNRKRGFFVVWMFYYPVVCIFSSKHNKKILGNKKFLDRGWPVAKLSRGFESLASLTNDDWKAMRNLVSPAYVSSVLESFIPTMLYHVGMLLEDFESRDGEVVDCIQVLRPHLMAITLETSMTLKNADHSMKTKLAEILYEHFYFQFDRVNRPHTWSNQIMGILNRIRGIKDEQEILKKYAQEIIKARIDERNAETAMNEIDLENIPRPRNGAFLDCMLDNLKSGSEEELESLSKELLGIMVTSWGTILNSTGWFIHNMAYNPDVQQKLYEELVDFNERDENMTIPQINELIYLDQCVHENLRIRPPVAQMFRKIEEDVDLDGHIIPKGILSTTFIHSIHHDEEIYPNPDEFDPSRFGPENFAEIPSGAYIPFGDGPRRCIGERLAILELKIIFSNLIKRFQIEPVEKEKAQIKIDIFTRSKRPYEFRLITRKNKNL